MMGANRLGVAEGLARIRDGTLTCTEWVALTLEEMRRREPGVRAWIAIDEERALEQARAADRVPEGQRGPLHGVPLAVKDTFDTKDFPTRLGSSVWAERRPSEDSRVVEIARSAGAIVLGKTITTEYALLHPGPTRNPHNAEYSPGGSSSGSAAAVAAFMAPLALGSQTNGSVLRPASYCGVYGIKPTFGMLSRVGLAPIATSLDTVGLFARDLEGLAIALETLAVPDVKDADSLGVSMHGLLDAVRAGATRKWRVGFCRTPAWDKCDIDARKRLEDFVEWLRREAPNADVIDIELPERFKQLYAYHMIIQDAGVAKHLSLLSAGDRVTLSEQLQENIRRGQAIPARNVREALDYQLWAREALDEILDTFDVAIGLAATGEAPRSIATTGDPVMQTPWTFCGTPALSVPALRGAKSMPLGLQVTAKRQRDSNVLGFAAFLESTGLILNPA